MKGSENNFSERLGNKSKHLIKTEKAMDLHSFIPSTIEIAKIFNDPSDARLSQGCIINK